MSTSLATPSSPVTLAAPPATGTELGRARLPEPALMAAQLAQPNARLTAAEVVDLVVMTLQTDPLTQNYATASSVRKYVRRAVEDLLAHLAELEGKDWQQRWEKFEEATTLTNETPWWNHLLPDGGKPAYRHYFNHAVGQLARHDVVRVNHAWLRHKSLVFVHELAGWRDRDAATAIADRYTELKISPGVVRQGFCHLGAICAHTGKTPRQVTSDEIVAFRSTLKALGRVDASGLFTLWNVIRSLGWFGDVEPKMPSPKLRMRRKTVEQLVDQHQIRSPHREVLIEYFKVRAATMDYSSLINNVRHVADLFWADVAAEHPDLTDFTLDRTQTQAWKQRLAVRRNGGPRQQIHATLVAVRAFYLDIGDWALNDSYWVPWATGSPVEKADLRGMNKTRRQTVARQQQRTRELAPLLPQLITAAEDYRNYTLANVDLALAAGAGGRVEIDGVSWEVRSVHSRDSVRVVSGRKQRHLGGEENRGFWTWAIIEILRHSGLRLEEMLELTHLAIQPYTVKPTGETIPLVHIPPSKTDEERLIVASPELVHVLSAVLKRVRGDQQQVPLTQRWDNHERELGTPLPHLLVHRTGGHLQPFTPASVHAWLISLARRADLTIAGQPAHLTPHDFRRLFATEALANGLPPHIVQVLLGHKSLATTQGYAAIYPQDIIAAHRSFITMRRRDRPSEEYREPTAEEWAEFEAHFVQRKLSLGTCGRAYGTSCQHEHACLRCGLLRPDPAQIDRLRDIVVNLADRITEAEQHNWLGEAEGLKVSHAAAIVKLEQMNRQLIPASSVDLGLPLVRKADL